MNTFILTIIFFIGTHSFGLAQRVYKDKIIYQNKYMKSIGNIIVLESKNIFIHGDTIISIIRESYKKDNTQIDRFSVGAYLNDKSLSIKEKYLNVISDQLDSPQAALQAFQQYNDYDEEILSESDKKNVNYTFIVNHAARLRKQAKK
jgi:hypothetical protein